MKFFILYADLTRTKARKCSTCLHSKVHFLCFHFCLVSVLYIGTSLYVINCTERTLFHVCGVFSGGGGEERVKAQKLE